jgi:hypothetical protein
MHLAVVCACVWAHTHVVRGAYDGAGKVYGAVEGAADAKVTQLDRQIPAGVGGSTCKWVHGKSPAAYKSECKCPPRCGRQYL